MDRFGLVLALLTASAGPVAAASPDPKDLAVPPTELAKARDLVEKLGSETYDDREDAQDDLAKMGRLALQPLVEGLSSHPSPEVRFRCQTLLPKAAAEDLHARLATFLADAEGKFEHDLPGWNEFRKITGETPAGRAVFVDLLADPVNRSLVLAAAGPPGEIGSLVAARKQELYFLQFPRTSTATRKEPSVADVTALMFAEAQVASTVVPRTISTTSLYTASGFSTAVADSGPKGRVYRAVAVHWMATRDDAIPLHQAVLVGSNLGLSKEAAGVAAKLVRLKGAVVSYRAQAATTIARLGARDQLPALEAVFGDDTVMRSIRMGAGGRAEPAEAQLRDLVLAAAVQLTDQDPAEYGFAGPAGATRFTWHLPADKRAAAFEKWKAWREKHPDAEKGRRDK
ncbi:MAG: hypothetical protein JWO38_6426 [Gemmataceae bacterium]|nr:hypothetical protein [Gemmataceae bacterium]